MSSVGVRASAVAASGRRICRRWCQMSSLPVRPPPLVVVVRRRVGNQGRLPWPSTAGGCATPTAVRHSSSLSWNALRSSLPRPSAVAGCAALRSFVALRRISLGRMPPLAVQPPQPFADLLRCRGTLFVDASGTIVVTLCHPACAAPAAGRRSSSLPRQSSPLAGPFACFLLSRPSRCSSLPGEGCKWDAIGRGLKLSSLSPQGARRRFIPANPPSSSSSRSSRAEHQEQPPGVRGVSVPAEKMHARVPVGEVLPPDRQEEFLNAHKLFGVSNIVKTIKFIQEHNRAPSDVDEAMKTMIYQSNARAADPVGGCCRIIWDLQRQIEMQAAELSHVRRQLAFFRAHHRQQQTNDHLDNVVLPPPPPLLLPPHIMDHHHHSSSSQTPSSPSSSSANNVFSYNNNSHNNNNNNGDSSYMQDLMLPPPLSYQQNQQQLMFHNLTLNDNQSSQELLGLEEQLEQNSCPNSNFQGLEQWLVHDSSTTRVSVDGQEEDDDHREQKIIITRDLMIDEKPCKRKRSEEATVVQMMDEDDHPKTLTFHGSKETIQVISDRVAEHDDDQKQMVEVDEKEAKSNDNVEKHNEVSKEVVPLLFSTSNTAL
ncbi:hypothetical protein Syun_026365 [Stephania yunnanensis]|uniref:LOB domain-containing protein n=1 Tax=Stephania yunnanensis TaxID=152371 RepID=A0AAP0EW19_9MAGN